MRGRRASIPGVFVLWPILLSRALLVPRGGIHGVYDASNSRTVRAKPTCGVSWARRSGSSFARRASPLQAGGHDHLGVKAASKRARVPEVESLRAFQKSGRMENEEEAELYRAAAWACLRGSRAEAGAQLLGEMEERPEECFTPPLTHYVTAVQAFVRAKQCRSALDLFERGLENHSELYRPSSGPGLPTGSPEHALWAVALQACGGFGEWEKGLELLERMSAQGCLRVGGQEYVHVIRACERAGQWRRAVVLLQRARESGVFMLSSEAYHNASREERNHRLTDLAFNMVLGALAQGGQWEQAVALLREMEASNDQRLRAIAALSEETSPSHRDGRETEKGPRNTKGGDHRRRSTIPPTNTNSNATPSAATPTPRELLPAPTLITYNSVIAACAKMGHWSEALQIMNNAKHRGIEPDVITYTAVISACARARPPNTAKALELLASMRFDGIDPDVVAYTAVMDACAKGRSLKNPANAMTPAESPFPRGKERRRGSSSSSSSSGDGGSTPVSNRSKQQQEHEGAENDREARRQDAIMHMWEATKVHTGPERALELLEEMVEAGIEPNERTYATAIAACAASGTCERALGLLCAARAKGFELDLAAYNSALHACERARQPLIALAVLHFMEARSGTHLSNRLATAESLATSHVLEAFERVARFEDAMGDGPCPAPDVRSYSAVIGACGKALLPAGSGSGRKSKRGDDNPEGLGLVGVAKGVSEALAESRTMVRWWAVALDVLERSRQRDPAARPNLFTYSAAMSACARGGQWRPAMALLDEMEDSGLQPDLVAFNAALHACHVGAEWRCALDILKRMRAAGVAMDVISLTDVLGALARARKRDTVRLGKHLTAEADRVFAAALSQEPPVLFGPPCLDSVYEVDFSGLPFPVARAALRWALQRVLVDRGLIDSGTVPDPSNVLGDDQPSAHDSGCNGRAGGGRRQEFTIITGVGVAAKRGRGQGRRRDRGDNPAAATTTTATTSTAATTMTSLREYVLELLETDFDPPLHGRVDKRTPGFVVVDAQSLERWIGAAAAAVGEMGGVGVV